LRRRHAVGYEVNDVGNGHRLFAACLIAVGWGERITQDLRLQQPSRALRVRGSV
jgi:hypothetical protein